MAEPGQPAGYADPMVGAETGMGVLVEIWQRAVEELGCLTPPAQLRALLVIDAAGRLNLTTLAGELGASPSAASKLCSRLETADLVSRDAAAESRREISLTATESGRRLAGWVREQRQAALARSLAQLSPAAQLALTRGLAELAGLVPQR